MVSLFLNTVLAFTLKFGALSPEGTSYMKIANQLKNDFENYTKGKVKIVWYAGGVMGDEPEMVKKIRMGQLHGGGFTGYGLGIIEGTIRMFELPGLFRDYDEFFYVKEKFEPEIKEMFRKKGFELLAYFPIGFIYIFSQKEITKLDDFKGVKLWVWAGDPLAGEVAQALKGYAQLVNLSIADVLTGLQTGMINAFYNLPYGAMALQWTNHIKYMLDYPVTLATGGVVVSSRAFKKLTEDQRKYLEKLISERFKEASESLVKENEKAVEGFKKKGIKFTRVDENSPEIKKFQDIFKKVHEKFKGKLYSPQMYDRLIKTIEEYRKSKKAN